jgi:hypothetical protein
VHGNVLSRCLLPARYSLLNVVCFLSHCGLQSFDQTRSKRTQNLYVGSCTSHKWGSEAVLQTHSFARWVSGNLGISCILTHNINIKCESYHIQSVPKMYTHI